MKSWNEIRKAATAFSKRWKTAFDEKSQAQSFGRRVRGHRRKISRGERRERGGRDAATLYILDDPKLTPDFDRRNPDSADGKVNGICDLIDFTPIYMDVSCIRDLPKKLRDNLTFKLRHESEAVNVVWTDLVQMSVGTFQKDDVAVCGQDVCWASNRHRLFEDDPEREFEMKVVLSAFASAALSMTCFSKAVYNKEVWRARDNGAKFDVMLSVIDDEGTPVANARCGGWMCMEHDSKHGRGYAVFTDTNGCVRVTGECSEWFSVVVRKDGYYKTSFDVKYPLENVDPPIADGKWQPYGETRNVVLKKIKNPGRASVFPDTLCRCRIPEFGKWIGFDFERSDWVAPYGGGEWQDVLLRFTATEKKLNDYKYEMEVSFTNNPYAGAYLLSEDASSELTTVYVADQNAEYRTSFKFVKEQIPGARRHWEFLGNDSYLVFRTRTRIDEQGNLIGAHYGKVRGQWLSELDYMILGDGCFNQTENDVNIEDGRGLRDCLRQKGRLK